MALMLLSKLAGMVRYTNPKEIPKLMIIHAALGRAVILGGLPALPLSHMICSARGGYHLPAPRRRWSLDTIECRTARWGYAVRSRRSGGNAPRGLLWRWPRRGTELSTTGHRINRTA